MKPCPQIKKNIARKFKFAYIGRRTTIINKTFLPRDACKKPTLHASNCPCSEIWNLVLKQRTSEYFGKFSGVLHNIGWSDKGGYPSGIAYLHTIILVCNFHSLSKILKSYLVQSSSCFCRYQSCIYSRYE